MAKRLRRKPDALEQALRARQVEIDQSVRHVPVPLQRHADQLLSVLRQMDTFGTIPWTALPPV